MIKKNLIPVVTASLAAALLGSAHAGTVKLLNPKDHIVFQRNNQNSAIVQVKGVYMPMPVVIAARPVALLPQSGGTPTAGTGTPVQALSAAQCRFTPVQPSWGTAIGWTNLPISGLAFFGLIPVQGGWYTMDLRLYVGGQLVCETNVNRVGVGEVFAATGHSNVAGDSDPSVACADERCVTINRTFRDGIWQNEPDFPYASVTTPTNATGPCSGKPWTYGPMSDALVAAYNVPVLVYNAGFGGSSSENWAMSSQHQYFYHSFLRWDWAMPYTNLHGVITEMAKRTGIRAILALHGENDGGEQFTPSSIENNYRTYFHQARVDGGMPKLAFMVAYSCGDSVPRSDTEILTNKQYIAQCNIINGTNDVFPGPELWREYPNDIYREAPNDIHYSTLGQQHFGQMWAACISPTFLSNSTPYLAVFE